MNIKSLRTLRTIEVSPTAKLLEDKDRFQEAVHDEGKLSPLEEKANRLLYSVLPILDLSGMKMLIPLQGETEPQEYTGNKGLAAYAMTITVVSMPRHEKELIEIKKALELLEESGLLSIHLMPP